MLKLVSFHQSVTVERQVAIPMRDGILLTADIYRPKQIDSTLPVLLMRLPYGRAISSTVTYAHPSWYANQGYIVVIQDVRGCGTSQGDFYPFRSEYADGYDTVQWCAERLQGSNGKVGMYGFSYQGVTQFQAAVMQPPGLVTICPAMATIDFYEGWFYFGGAIALEFVLEWALQLCQNQAQFRKLEPLATQLFQAQKNLSHWLHQHPLDQLSILKDLPLAEFFFDWISNSQASDRYWQELNPLSYFDDYDLPALHIAGWADLFITATMNSYEKACEQTRSPQKLIVGPWQHIPWDRKVGEIDFGETAVSNIDQIQIEWFDYWLKGIDMGIISKSTQAHSQRLFLMGKNQWIDIFPVPIDEKEVLNSTQVFYLHPQGQLKSVAPSYDNPPDVYVYDPRNPTPSNTYGQYDQRSIHQRWDILLYQSELLTEDLSVVGIPDFTLFASTSAITTDWVIKLIDIYADGRQMLISMGVLRANFLDPDCILKHQIRFRPTAHCFILGHRIGIAIASAAFPLIGSHSNTKKPPQTASVSDFCEATQQIYHSLEYASALHLPMTSTPNLVQ